MTETKTQRYQGLASQLHSLLEGQRDLIANAANTAALIYHGLPDVNWAGFYFLRGDQLLLGPFQGKPACVQIPVGEGVCGRAARELQTVVVANVHEFPGHIACDDASNSEIVVPLISPEGCLIGVLDLDSPLLGRFDHEDQVGLERLAEIFVTLTDMDVG